MAWVSVSCIVDSGNADRLSDALLEAGAISAEVSDAAEGTDGERPIYDEPGEVRSVWPQSRVAALFSAASRWSHAFESAFAQADLAVPPFDVRPVGEQDWVSLSRDQFKPIRISPRLWIVPTWNEPVDPAAINIRLDPGLAFGTGSHPTTRLALGFLERTVRPADSVLDYGCGSGILAIVAARLGARPVTGIDIDPQAVEAARRNALANDVAATFHPASGMTPAAADIVVANILANPLRVLAPLLAAVTRPGGRLAISGILAGQAGELAAVYAPWFAFGPPEELDGWVLLSGPRRPA